MTNYIPEQTNTSPYAVVKEEYAGSGVGGRADELAAALKKIDAGYSLTVPVELATPNPHWISVRVSTLGRELDRRFRVQRQKDGSVKVFRVEGTNKTA